MSSATYKSGTALEAGGIEGPSAHVSPPIGTGQARLKTGRRLGVASPGPAESGGECNTVTAGAGLPWNAFKRLKTAEEIAPLVRPVSAERILELARGGYCPHYVVEGKTLFLLSQVREWVANNLTAVRPGASFPVALQVPVEGVSTVRVPKELENLAPLLSVVREHSYPTAVYFLVRDNRVVYVGQSVNVLVRLYTHRQEKAFDYALWLPVPKESLDEVEGALIRLLKPALNGNAGPCLAATADVLAPFAERAARGRAS